MKVYKKFFKCFYAFDFDRVRALTKVQRIISILQVFSSFNRGKSEKRWRVPTHEFESLISLIRDVGMFLDLVNIVER